MSVTPLHPPISEAKISYFPQLADEPFINMAGVIHMVKGNDTPQCKRLYRLYLAEFRALEGQPITHEKREEQAMMAAMKRFGLNFVNIGQAETGGVEK